MKNRYTQFEMMQIKHLFKIIFMARRMRKKFPDDAALRFIIHDSQYQLKKIYNERKSI